QGQRCDTIIYQTTEQADVISYSFFNDTQTAEIYPLSLHDALPIYYHHAMYGASRPNAEPYRVVKGALADGQRRAREMGQRTAERSEEHTSELQSREKLVCRLLLEKKKKCKRLNKTIVKYPTKQQ